MNQRLLSLIPGIEGEEFVYVSNLTHDLSDDRLNYFAAIYNGKRQKPETILIITCLGFVVVAGIQRFVLGQIGMGILYLLTFGLCLIGTIIDVVNYKKLTYEFNVQMANQSLAMIDSLR